MSALERLRAVKPLNVGGVYLDTNDLHMGMRVIEATLKLQRAMPTTEYVFAESELKHALSALTKD